jgi:hypothetical protein
MRYQPYTQLSFRRFSSLLSLIVLAGLWACSKDPTNFAVEPKDLTPFHTQYVAKADAPVASDSVSVYIDYSKGMHEGMMASMDFVKEMLTMVNSPKTVYFKAGTNDVPPRINVTATENIPWNISNYTQTRSVLDEPVRQITGDNRTGVFITDFELVKGLQELQIVQNGKTFRTSIDISAWAVNEFENWLKQGNAIDVFAQPFTKQNSWVPQSQSQHMYILVFTPKALIHEPSALVNRLLEKQGGIKHFRFSAEDIALTNKYKDKANEGGATENAVPNMVQVSFPAFEYYQFNQKDLFKIPEYSEKDIRFVKNLFLANAPVNYPDLQLEAKVYDITSEYQKFYDAANPVEGEKPAKYSYTAPGTTDDVFVLEFDPKKREIGLKLHENFTGVEFRTLYKVDVVVKEAKPQFDNALLSSLKWTDARGFEVPSLASSLTEALARINLKDRVVYTYYVELVK